MTRPRGHRIILDDTHTESIVDVQPEDRVDVFNTKWWDVSDALKKVNPKDLWKTILDELKRAQ